MRLSYLGKLPLFFTLGIDMRQFLLGTVQRITFERNCSVLRITKRQFLLGTVLHHIITVVLDKEVQAYDVSIPLRYGTTLTQE